MTTELIKEGYYIEYTDKYENTDKLTLRFFSKENMHDPKLKRKYLGQHLSEIRKSNGKEELIARIMWFYEVFIPKEALTLNREKSRWCYISYQLGNTEIVNSTSGWTDNGSLISLQSDIIRHCRKVNKKQFSLIMQHALPVNETLHEAEEEFTVDIDLIQIMFINKYANGKTNYNKNTNRYNKFSSQGLHPLIIDILSNNCHLTPQHHKGWQQLIISGQAPKGTMDIYFDYLNMSDLYSQQRLYKTIPKEVMDAYCNLKSI